ncbi:MAG: hypothetical protein HFF70_11185 [Oscillospiraceae bacterium]|nr:hypothetical protein [Oscillospiraceae bacterium]
MKRKRVWFLLCGVAITGILCVVILQKGSTKSEIFDYVQGNQADLERFAVELIRVNGKDAKYRNWPVAYYEDVRTVEFLTKGSGLGPVTTYEGFYYSENDVPVGFQGVELDFIQDGDGWIWREANGDNCDQTERITEHWFWFKMSF